MSALPKAFADWFTRQGWTPHGFQLDLLAHQGDALLIAPTGGGKTLAGFLPSLVDLAEGETTGLHTLYVSPLKALTQDIARNLARPIADLALPIRVEERTGDTKASRRAVQRVNPPHILLTTPESLALMLTYPESARIFGGLKRVVIDELHALAESKRGDHLMLCLARLRSLAPQLRCLGLSATVDHPAELADFMGGATVITAPAGPMADIALLPSRQAPPWAGAGGRYAVKDVLEAIEGAEATIIFHNTRAQAELFFQALWLANDAGLPIALHHGSLSKETRQRVEAAMATGQLRAIVATGSLDLGLDWGNVDLVIQIGSPRQVKRLAQRIGRSNHRFDSPSKARLLPVNRFDVIECTAALQALTEGDLDGTTRHAGPLEVLCQHILNLACAGPIDEGQLLAEVRRAGPYRKLTRADFDACLDLAATGGYALRAYDRWQRLKLREGHWTLRDPRAARQIRMNIGTIIGREMVRVKSRGRGGAYLGEVEESFAATLRPGDSFLLGGRTLRYNQMRDLTVEVTPQRDKDPKIPVYGGQTMSSSLELSRRVLDMLAEPRLWTALPEPVQAWLRLQEERSALPHHGMLLCESFPYQRRNYLAIYGFAGKNAHQALGLLVSHHMEIQGLAPMGYLATDHALLLSALRPIEDVGDLLGPEGIEPALKGWFEESSILRRSFREVATIAGLLHRNFGGTRKTGRQATFSSDIIYDALRRHDPDHLLLRASADHASRVLIDQDRLKDLVAQFPQARLMRLDRVSPLAAPLLLQLGRVKLAGEGQELAAQAMAEALMAKAGLDRIEIGEHDIGTACHDVGARSNDQRA